MNEKLIERDRLRYSKNKFSSGLALLSIVFNALFFASIYRSVQEDVGTYYFTIIVGASVLYNLLFMLAAFLSSEGVKNYKLTFAFVLFVLAAGQIVRIFIFPMGAHSTVLDESTGKLVMKTAQFIRCIVYMVASATCLVVAGVFGIIRSLQLKEHMSKYGNGKVDFGEEEKEEAPVVDVNQEDASASAGVMDEEPVSQGGSDDNIKE